MRLSQRHLLALGTFLVPLIMMSVLGWNELQNSRQMAIVSSEGEARQFLARAEDAITRQINSRVTQALNASIRWIVDESPIRAAIKLRDVEDIPGILDVLLIDDDARLVWPRLPLYTVSLPLIREPSTGSDSQGIPDLVAAELLMQHGRWHEAAEKLATVVELVRTANQGSRRWTLLRAEAHACFMHATALRKLGQNAAARSRLMEVQAITSTSSSSELIDLNLLVKGVLAELGAPENRITLLREIAEDGYPSATDGLAGAIAERMAESFDADSPLNDDIQRYLIENKQRAASREFASDYSQVFSYQVRPRVRSRDSSTPPMSEERLVSTDTAYPMLLAIRPATEEEQNQLQCSFVALHFDLDALIEPTATSLANDESYALSITSRNGAALWAPTKPVPSDYVAPSIETNGLTLRVFPADPEKRLADADSAANKRALLVLALLFTALGGALWSWRSVSREAELAALKINLVSRVSHELKTPLALIRMYGETIGMGRVRDPGQTSEFGSIIARESERLTTLINRILDFSRQQSGTLSYQTEPHDIGQLLRTTAYAYAPHLEEKGVILIDSLPLGIVVSCDKDGLEGAIINLLENATKYGPNDDNEHEVELILQSHQKLAIIEVQDRGRGIPSGEHNRIFEGFFRASNSGEIRGAGLGLGIVQHFARAHEGDIEALPREGGGTIMRITLPLATSNTNSPSTTHAPNKTPGTPT